MEKGRVEEMKNFTKEEALQRAREYGLEDEVATAMAHGLTPDEALEDWDLYPFDSEQGRGVDVE